MKSTRSVTAASVRRAMDELDKLVAAKKAAARPPSKARPAKPAGPAPTYLFEGAQHTVHSLAAIAKCSPGVMRRRLEHGDAATSVAMGKAAARGARRRQRRPQPSAGLTAPTNKPVVPVAAEAPAFAAEVVATVPVDVKHTVWERPAAPPVPSTFGRIGQYESTGSAIERYLRGRKP